MPLKKVQKNNNETKKKSNNEVSELEDSYVEKCVKVSDINKDVSFSA